MHLSRVVHVSLQACQSIKAPDPLRQCRSTWQMLDIAGAGLYQTRWQCNLPSWCYLFRKCMKLLIAETVLPTNVSCSKVINRHPSTIAAAGMLKYFMELFVLFLLFTRFAKLFLIAPNSGDCKFCSKSALECGPERGRNVQVMSKYFGSRPWFYCFNLPGEATRVVGTRSVVLSIPATCANSVAKQFRWTINGGSAAVDQPEILCG